MSVYDIGDLLTRAKNSLDHGLRSLSAFTVVAGGISELSPNDQLPESKLFFRYGFGPEMKEGNILPDPILNEVREHFGSYAANYAVLTMVAAFEVYLERFLWIAMLIAFAENKGATITDRKIFELHLKSQSFAQGKNPVQMIEEINKRISIQESTPFMVWFQSIYNARKILSHRGGVVSDTDVNEKGEFRLIWRTIEIKRKEDGSQVLRFVETEHVYKIGDTLNFTPKDCQEIAFSLVSCANVLTQSACNKAVRYLRAD